MIKIICVTLHWKKDIGPCLKDKDTHQIIQKTRTYFLYQWRATFER